MASGDGLLPITAAPPPQGLTWHTGLDYSARWPLQWLHGLLSYTSCIPLVGNPVSRQSWVLAPVSRCSYLSLGLFLTLLVQIIVPFYFFHLSGISVASTPYNIVAGSSSSIF